MSSPKIQTANVPVELDTSYQQTGQNPLIKKMRTDSIKIGHVVFSLKNATKKNNIEFILQNWYTPQYITCYFIEKQNKPRIIFHHQGGNDNMDKTFKLQMAELFHYRVVVSTDQTEFNLKMTDHEFLTGNNKNYFGMQMLWSIEFKNLKTLNISDQKIVSLEGLTYASFPFLQKLEIQKNLITNLNVLSKCSFKNLKYLACQKNAAFQCISLERTHFPKLEHIILNLRRDLSEKKLKNLNPKRTDTVQGIGFVFKLESLFNMKQVVVCHRQKTILDKHLGKLSQINGAIKNFRQIPRNRHPLGRFHPRPRRLVLPQLLYQPIQPMEQLLQVGQWIDFLDQDQWQFL